MISSFIKKFFGSRNGRILKEYAPLVKKINELEDKYQKFTQSDFQVETKLLKEKYRESNNLDNILPEAFALTREASIRTLGLRHFDEQILGGIGLHFGKIAEMKTGEGKTLVSTLPAYLNSLSDQPVFIITVNDYLAVRDSEWMEVGAWVYKHFDEVSGVSFLPHSDHTYQQAPYQDIDKEKYNELKKLMPKSVDFEELKNYENDDNTTGTQELACTAGACEIVDITSQPAGI